MVKLYESMASSFNKYLNEEVEEKENINECDNISLTEAPIYDLAPNHDARKSFYSKARVDDEGDVKTFSHVENINECNDSFVESINKVLSRKNESLQPDENLDEYCDRLLDTLSEAIGYDKLCTEIIDYVSVQTLVEVLEHIAEIYKVDVDSYIINESGENLTESAWDELKSFLR